MTERAAPATTRPAPPTGDQAALRDALRAVLVPLAQLAVARGLPYAEVDEMFRVAYVAAAHAAHPGLPEHRRASRISATTGLNRREIVRLTAAAEQPVMPARSFTSEVFAHWTTHPDYLDKRGRPRRLPRLGEAPSFESLAQAVTKSMHPRSLLEELLRLELATHDPRSDTVTLASESFVPRGDRARMHEFLGHNVGDHLSAAVANVVAEGGRHFEQAIFADGLSERSLAALRGLITQQWRAMTTELVPKLEKMIADDEASGDAASHRVRIGLFSYDALEPVRPVPVAAPVGPLIEAPRRRAARTKSEGAKK